VIKSKLTSKAQTTIPQPIRAALRLREGDELVYEIQGDRVVLSKGAQVRDSDDPFTTFSECPGGPQGLCPAWPLTQGDVAQA
jgi:antitoxin PrlF